MSTSYQGIADWFAAMLDYEFFVSVAHSENDDALEIRIMPKRYMLLTVPGEVLRASKTGIMAALRKEAAKARQWERDGFKVPRAKEEKR